MVALARDFNIVALLDQAETSDFAGPMTSAWKMIVEGPAPTATWFAEPLVYERFTRRRDVKSLGLSSESLRVALDALRRHARVELIGVHRSELIGVDWR